MQPTYFASFFLGESDTAPPPPIDGALNVIGNWIFNNPHRVLPRPTGWPDKIIEPIQFPSGEKIQLLRLHQNGGLETAAVRFEHGDRESRLWRTDCVLANSDQPRPRLRFAVTVAAGSSGDSLNPVNPPISRPRIVRSMMQRYGARERYPLKATFLRIESSEAQQFAEFLFDPGRTIPVVFVSKRNTDKSLACDVAILADRLAGIAYVCVEGDPQLTWNLSEYISDGLNTYDGAVRVYWPNMTTADSPYRHRLWTPQRIFMMNAAQRSFVDELLTIIASASVTRRIPGFVRWEDVERENTRQAIQRIHGASIAAGAEPPDFEDWLRQYQEDLSTLESLRQEFALTVDKLQERDEEVRQWKQLYIQSQRALSAGLNSIIDDEIIIQDAMGAIEFAQKEFRDRLVFIEGRIEKETREFKEPELLYAALKWLGTIYWESKSGTGRCSDFDKSCRETCQFRYNAHQSDVTMGMFSSDYEVLWKGKKYRLREHIGFGTSTEPRHTIRLAFFFEPNEKKVVVGYIGQHQSTRKSN